MLGGSKGWTALAGVLVVCAALLGCGGEPSIASQSAEAFREAQQKGEPVGGGGHGHGHGSSDHGSTAPEGVASEAGPGGEHPAGHDHGAAEAPAGGGEHEGHGAHGGHEAQGAADAGQHGGDHSAMGHGRSATSSRGGTPKGHEESGHSGHAGHSEQAGHSGGTGQAGHAGHGTASPQAPGATAPPQGDDHAGHTGHSASAGESPTAPAPVTALPGQPAKTLQPDSLDAPAATSVIDAQRSAEMAQGMAGGHGGHGSHGVGRYRHVDAGRGPEAQETAGLYVCPMHPDVTSDKPGTCPKCGMALVERRKE